MKHYPKTNGVETFLELTDTNDYSSDGGKFVKVKASADGLEYATGSGGASWGSITGTLSNQTDLDTELSGKASTSHTHAATDVSSGTLADARVAQSNVTQHQAALLVTESQISDLQAYLTSETSHADVVVDGDFASDGLLLRSGGAGSYGTTTDNSSNWDTAYTHSQAAHAPTNADNTAANETSHANVLVDADIGVNVQAYSAVLQATTASFLTADETKLDGLPADADNTASNETSHANVVVDGDFSSDGFLKRSGGSGSYTVDTETYSPTSHTHGQLHDRSHAMTGASDHTATNWRVFYSNGSGDVAELALGTSGQYLKSQGVSSAPAWDTPAGGGGTTVTFFQVEDDGTTGQLTTGSAADLAGMWGTPSLTDSDFSWNGTTGILTVNTTGTVEFDIKVCGYNNANNRNELHIQLYKNGSTVIVEDAQYASRNNTQDEGSAYICGFKDSATATDTYRVRVFDIGVAVTIGASNVSGMTYISAKLYT